MSIPSVTMNQSALATKTSSNGSLQVVDLDNVLIGDTNMANTAGNYIKILTPGIYVIVVQVHDSGDPTAVNSFRAVQCQKSALGTGAYTNIGLFWSRANPGNSSDSIVQGSLVVKLLRDDRLRMLFQQNSGDTLTLSTRTFMSASMLPIQALV